MVVGRVGGIEKPSHIQRKARRLSRSPGIVTLKEVAKRNPEKG